MDRTFRFVRIAVVLLMCAAAVSASAIAAPGGNKGARGGGTGPAISFDSGDGTAVVVGEQYRVNGSGFRADSWVSVGAYFTDTTWWASGVTDGQGRFSFTLTATSPGDVLHEAYEQGNSGRFRLKKTATLTVSQA